MSGIPTKAQYPSRKLYELAGGNIARKTSPFCWRIRFALAEKQLSYDSIPWRRVDKDVLEFTGQGKVPVFIDGEHTIHDSWKIAEYLENCYPDAPSLFHSKTGYHASRFAINWVDECLLKAMRNIIALGALAVSASQDQDYYRDKLQNVHGVSLQNAGDSQSNKAHLHTVLEPMRLTLKNQKYLGGQEPSFADFAAAGAFAWARSVSPIQLLQENDPVHAWRAGMFQRFQQDMSSTIGFLL